MTLAARLELVARIAETRAVWRDVERLADDLLDDELDSRIAIARLAILDAADRLAQLIDHSSEKEASPA